MASKSANYSRAPAIPANIDDSRCAIIFYGHVFVVLVVVNPMEGKPMFDHCGIVVWNVNRGLFGPCLTSVRPT